MFRPGGLESKSKVPPWLEQAFVRPTAFTPPYRTISHEAIAPSVLPKPEPLHRQATCDFSTMIRDLLYRAEQQGIASMFKGRTRTKKGLPGFVNGFPRQWTRSTAGKTRRLPGSRCPRYWCKKQCHGPGVRAHFLSAQDSMLLLTDRRG